MSRVDFTLRVWVYPRVYGESDASGIWRMVDLGLSPRVRGIPSRSSISLLRFGSIPACTGNPYEIQVSDDALTVYPRVYGESTRWSP